LSKKAAGRRFGLTIGTAFLLLTSALLWRDRDFAALITGGLGMFLVAAGLALPTMLGPVERAWMAMAHAISRVTTPIILGIVYFLVITPIGLVMRGLGKNPLAHEESEPGSYWISTAEGASKRGGMTRQF
jgi:hypothetical protein